MIGGSAVQHRGMLTGSTGRACALLQSCLNAVPARTSTSLLALLLLQACTSITVHGANGVTRDRYFGLRLVHDDSNAPLVLQSRSYGLDLTSDGLTLGYADRVRVSVKDAKDCHAIFILSNETQIQALKEEFGLSTDALSSICIARGINQP